MLKLERELYPFNIKTILLYALLCLGSLFLCLCAFFFFLPLIASFVPLFSSKYSLNEGKGVLFESFKIWKIFKFTILSAFFSSTLATLIGLVSAFFCANRRFKGKKLLLSFSGIPLSVPPLIIALAYMLFFGNNGFVFGALKKLFNIQHKSFLYSTFGIILAQGFYNFPLAMRFITESWQNIPNSEIESAILLGAKKGRIFKTITLPYLAPSIISSFLLIFLFCFFSFVIVLLFSKVGTSTIEVELYKCISYSLDARMAAKISILELSFASVLLILHSYFKERGRYTKIEILHDEPKIKKGIELLSFIILIFLIMFFLVLPLFSIFLYSVYLPEYRYSKIYSFSFRAWKNLFSSLVFWKSLLNSIYVALASTIISSLASIFLCYIKLFYLPKRKIDILPFLPLIASSVMLGFGYSLILKRANVLILIFTQSSLFYLYAYSQMHLSILRLPSDLISASLLLSNSKVRTFFYVVLPLSYKALFSGALFVFAMSASDASLPLVLNIENFSSLSLLLFHFASSYRLSESAALSIILLIISSVSFYLKDF